jgi:Flp pilus assembly protein TadD
MQNPYDVLGLPPQADDQALREAYRRLARQYEGDSVRLREIDDAYDSIILARGQDAGYRNQGGARDYVDAPPDLSDIRRQIQSGRFDDALTLLNGMQAHERTAEWHYLKGCAQRGRGWLEEAETCFATALRLAPDNREYRAAYEQMREDHQARRREPRGRDDGCDCCGICTGLLCLDCLCDCC